MQQEGYWTDIRKNFLTPTVTTYKLQRRWGRLSGTRKQTCDRNGLYQLQSEMPLPRSLLPRAGGVSCPKSAKALDVGQEGALPLHHNWV